MGHSSPSSDVPSASPTDLEKHAVNTTTDVVVGSVHSAASCSDEYGEYVRMHEYYQAHPKELARLVRLLDLRVLPMLFLYYLLNALDKTNAGNVKIYTFMQDTHMNGTQFNLALTWFFFTYAGLDAPSNMLLHKIGPRIWLSTIVALWGLVTLGTAWVHSYGNYCLVRVLLGACEAGLFEGSFYTIGSWYLPGEVQTRCAWWYSSGMVSGAFGGLLAYAVGPLHRFGLKPWQWLFVIEGAVTTACGLLGLWLCPGLPDNWSSCWFRPDEMRYLKLRVKYRDGPVPPDATFRWSALFEAMRDWKGYFVAGMLAFGGTMPTYAVNYTLPTMVKSLGYSSVKAQLMVAPPYIFAFFCIILIAMYSDKYQCRARSVLISYTTGTVGIIILWATLYHPHLSGVSYFALFLVVAGYNMQAPGVSSWLGSNVRNPAKRAAAMGWQATLGMLAGGCAGSNIFLTSEAPTYRTGFTVLLVLLFVGGYGGCIGYWYCLRAANKKKDRTPPEEYEGKYTDDELSKMGEDAPYFRYIL